MSLLSTMLDPGFRQAASVLIQVGTGQSDLGELAALVSNVEISTARDEAASGTITIDDRRREDGTWMAADSGLFARWEPIVITADFQTFPEEIFRGYITTLKPEAPQNAGEAKLVIEVQDDSVALNREHMRHVWEEDAPLNDLEILRELVAPLDLAVDGACHEGQSARSLAQDATAIVFLRERALANGYELIFDRGTVYFGPMRIEGEAQSTILIYAGNATNCLDFAITDDAQMPDAVGFDLAPSEEGATPVVEVVTPDLPLLGTIASGTEGAGLGTSSIAKLGREGDESEESTRSRAQALANANAFKIRATGTLDGTRYGHVLRAGYLVRVDGVGTRNSGPYYVDKVVHAFSPEGYRQQFELIRNATGDSDGLSAPPLSSVLSAISSLF